MGIKTYKDKNGKRMVKGAPAGAWAIWVLAVLVMIINIPITITNPIVGIIIFIIMSLLFFIGRKYAQVARIKASRKSYIAEYKELEKLTDEEWTQKDPKELEKQKVEQQLSDADIDAEIRRLQEMKQNKNREEIKGD